MDDFSEFSPHHVLLFRKTNLTSLKALGLSGNQLTSVPAAIRELIAAGCHVYLDDGVTVDE